MPAEYRVELDRSFLEKKRADIQERFDSLTTHLNNDQIEQHCLRGEYRLIQSLLETFLDQPNKKEEKKNG
jgi:hypothetical protein